MKFISLLPTRRRERIVAIATFAGAMVIGAAFNVRATPPCPIGESALLEVTTVTVDGADKTPPTGDFFLQNGNAPEVVPFNATVYDPDTGKERTLELKKGP
ncbi:MAG: hypothetical protein U0359_05800 [Byssovorax sp.]